MVVVNEQSAADHGAVISANLPKVNLDVRRSFAKPGPPTAQVPAASAAAGRSWPGRGGGLDPERAAASAAAFRIVMPISRVDLQRPAKPSSGHGLWPSSWMVGLTGNVPSPGARHEPDEKAMEARGASSPTGTTAGSVLANVEINSGCWDDLPVCPDRQAGPATLLDLGGALISILRRLFHAYLGGPGCGITPLARWAAPGAA